MLLKVMRLTPNTRYTCRIHGSGQNLWTKQPQQITRYSILSQNHTTIKKILQLNPIIIKFKKTYSHIFIIYVC